MTTTIASFQDPPGSAARQRTLAVPPSRTLMIRWAPRATSRRLRGDVADDARAATREGRKGEAQMKEFKGKVAVVTGAASGIGRAVAERLAVEGVEGVLAEGGA